MEHGLKLTVTTPFNKEQIELHSLHFLERPLVAADFRLGRMMWANWPPDFKVVKAELVDRDGKVVGDGVELLNKIIANLTISAQDVKTAQEKPKS